MQNHWRRPRASGFLNDTHGNHSIKFLLDTFFDCWWHRKVCLLYGVSFSSVNQLVLQSPSLAKEVKMLTIRCNSNCCWVVSYLWFFISLQNKSHTDILTEEDQEGRRRPKDFQKSTPRIISCDRLGMTNKMMGNSFVWNSVLVFKTPTTFWGLPSAVLTIVCNRLKGLLEFKRSIAACEPKQDTGAPVSHNPTNFLSNADKFIRII